MTLLRLILTYILALGGDSAEVVYCVGLETKVLIIAREDIATTRNSKLRREHYRGNSYIVALASLAARECHRRCSICCKYHLATLLHIKQSGKSTTIRTCKCDIARYLGTEFEQRCHRAECKLHTRGVVTHSKSGCRSREIALTCRLLCCYLGLAVACYDSLARSYIAILSRERHLLACLDSCKGSAVDIYLVAGLPKLLGAI